MNEVIDVEDAAFENSRDLSPHPNKKRSTLVAFANALETEANDLETEAYILNTEANTLKKQKRVVLDYVDAANRTSLLSQILQTLTEFKGNQEEFNSRIELRMKKRVLGSMGLEPFDIPFVKPSVIPEGKDLPFIKYPAEIEQLNVSSVNLYLKAYDIPFDNRWSSKKLKNLLRFKLGFTNLRDFVAVNMT